VATVTDSSAQVHDDGLQRQVGLLGLMWASEGSIIGSGWLFGALLATTLAGPGSIVSWGIAAAIVILLALVHAELGGIFPVTGGTSRFPHYTFGSLAGASFGWMSYLQAATVAPIEVLATIQYMSSAQWAAGFYTGTKGTLSGSGYGVAVGLMIFFVILNLVGIRWWAQANNSITTWKVLIPVLAIVVLLLTHFHGSNFSAGGGFWIKGESIPKSIMLAIPGGGIVFALLGFEQAVQLGGESANPRKDLPRAVIGSVIIGSIIYIIVQFAFVGALTPATIAAHHSWATLAKDAALNASPYYTVAKVAGLAWLAWILRVDAVVSPGGTGLIYMTSTSRVSYGLSKNGYIPSIFEKVGEKSRVPWFSVLAACAVGLLFLLPFPSWGKLVGVVTSASVLMYAAAPLSLGALRLTKPNLPRPYKLPAAKVLAPLSFILANFIVYWAGWSTYTAVIAALIIGYALMLLSSAFKLNDKAIKMDWTAAKWIFPYFIGMGVISYFGGFGAGGIIGGIGGLSTVWVGGSGELPLYWDLVVIAAFSLVIYYTAIGNRLSEAEVDQLVKDVYPEPSITH